MPSFDGDNGTSPALQNRISFLEAAITTWTKQIKNVLNQDPESQLKRGFHPTPEVEIEFWKSKANNLNSVFDQLQGEKIRCILDVLEQAKSTYCTTFSQLCKEVYNAQIEANDHVKYLGNLEVWFEKLSNTDNFPALKEVFKPMLHTLLLVWKKL